MNANKPWNLDKKFWYVNGSWGENWVQWCNAQRILGATLHAKQTFLFVLTMTTHIVTDLSYMCNHTQRIGVLTLKWAVRLVISRLSATSKMGFKKKSHDEEIKNAKDLWFIFFTWNRVFIRSVLDVFSFIFSAPLGYVSNFKVTSYTSTTIDVAWSPIVGATEYKLSWKTGNIFIPIPSHYTILKHASMPARLKTLYLPYIIFTTDRWIICLLFCFRLMLADNSKPQVQYLDRSILFHRLKDLNPQSTYTVTICAVYGNSEGPEISLSQLTGTKHMWSLSDFEFIMSHL